MPKQNAMTTALRSTLEGSRFDRDTLSRFIQEDRGTQQQILEDLAKGQFPQSLKEVKADFAPLASARSIDLQEEITASTHWWGYEVFIPENVMQELAQAPDLVATVTGLLTGVLTGPLAIVFGIVTGYIVAEFMLMKKTDQGRGVKLTATWLAAVVLIPSAL